MSIILLASALLFFNEFSVRPLREYAKKDIKESYRLANLLPVNQNVLNRNAHSVFSAVIFNQNVNFKNDAVVNTVF